MTWFFCGIGRRLSWSTDKTDRKIQLRRLCTICTGFLFRHASQRLFPGNILCCIMIILYEWYVLIVTILMVPWQFKAYTVHTFHAATGQTHFQNGHSLSSARIIVGRLQSLNNIDPNKIKNFLTLLRFLRGFPQHEEPHASLALIIFEMLRTRVSDLSPISTHAD